jgi:hypothetical protein
MRRKSATGRRRSTSLPSGRAGLVCMWAAFGRGVSVSNTPTDWWRSGKSRPQKPLDSNCPGADPVLGVSSRAAMVVNQRALGGALEAEIVLHSDRNVP